MENIKNLFNNYTPYINGADQYKKASITIPLVNINGEINLLFQLRSKMLSSNPSEICFPGGTIEKGESPKEAAIRETCEELGLKESDFNIISPLNVFISPFNIIIHPYLIEIKNYNNIDININEVEEILLIPLKFLQKYTPKSYINKLNMETPSDFPYDHIPNGKNYRFKTGTYETLFYFYNHYTIWGLTAKILNDFLQEIITLDI